MISPGNSHIGRLLLGGQQTRAGLPMLRRLGLFNVLTKKRATSIIVMNQSVIGSVAAG